MTPSAVKTEIKAVIAIVLVLAIFGAGWTVADWRAGAAMARYRETVQADKAHAATETLARVTAANKRADGLAGDLAAAESQRQTLAQEHYREIQRLTTGRPCLSGAVVRLLNEPAGVQHAGAVSQAAREPIRDDAAAASDTDVAQWADFARRSYDTCRGRLQAIADFFSGEPSPTAQTEAGDSALVCADCGN